MKTPVNPPVYNPCENPHQNQQEQEQEVKTRSKNKNAADAALEAAPAPAKAYKEGGGKSPPPVSVIRFHLRPRRVSRRH